MRTLVLAGAIILSTPFLFSVELNPVSAAALARQHAPTVRRLTLELESLRVRHRLAQQGPNPSFETEWGLGNPSGQATPYGNAKIDFRVETAQKPTLRKCLADEGLQYVHSQITQATRLAGQQVITWVQEHRSLQRQIEGLTWVLDRQVTTAQILSRIPKTSAQGKLEPALLQAGLFPIQTQLALLQDERREMESRLNLWCGLTNPAPIGTPQAWPPPPPPLPSDQPASLAAQHWAREKRRVQIEQELEQKERVPDFFLGLSTGASFGTTLDWNLGGRFGMDLPMAKPPGDLAPMLPRKLAEVGEAMEQEKRARDSEWERIRKADRDMRETVAKNPSPEPETLRLLLTGAERDLRLGTLGLTTYLELTRAYMESLAQKRSVVSRLWALRLQAVENFQVEVTTGETP